MKNSKLLLALSFTLSTAFNSFAVFDPRIVEGHVWHKDKLDPQLKLQVLTPGSKGAEHVNRYANFVKPSLEEAVNKTIETFVSDQEVTHFHVPVLDNKVAITQQTLAKFAAKLALVVHEVRNKAVAKAGQDQSKKVIKNFGREVLGDFIIDYVRTKIDPQLEKVAHAVVPHSLRDNRLMRYIAEKSVSYPLYLGYRVAFSGLKNLVFPRSASTN